MLPEAGSTHSSYSHKLDTSHFPSSLKLITTHHLLNSHKLETSHSPSSQKLAISDYFYSLPQASYLPVHLYTQAGYVSLPLFLEAGNLPLLTPPGWLPPTPYSPKLASSHLLLPQADFLPSLTPASEDYDRTRLVAIPGSDGTMHAVMRRMTILSTYWTTTEANIKPHRLSHVRTNTPKLATSHSHYTQASTSHSPYSPNTATSLYPPSTSHSPYSTNLVTSLPKLAASPSLYSPKLATSPHP